MDNENSTNVFKLIVYMKSVAKMKSEHMLKQEQVNVNHTFVVDDFSGWNQLDMIKI